MDQLTRQENTNVDVPENALQDLTDVLNFGLTRLRGQRSLDEPLQNRRQRLDDIETLRSGFFNATLTGRVNRDRLRDVFDRRGLNVHTPSTTVIDFLNPGTIVEPSADDDIALPPAQGLPLPTGQFMINPALPLEQQRSIVDFQRQASLRLQRRARGGLFRGSGSGF